MSKHIYKAVVVNRIERTCLLMQKVDGIWYTIGQYNLDRVIKSFPNCIVN